jgi:hypothetical protein
MFDIKNRTLILPIWKDITKDMYDLLVLHEVGHALNTPLEGWHGAVSAKGPNYKGFLNITEDARIEKKQKRKYPGGRKAFINGYKDLIARDFFGLKDRDIATFGLIDRLNIHFKAGMVAGVPFSTDEQVWVDRMAGLESFEDAVSLANDLFEMMKSDMPETDTGQGLIGEDNPSPEGDDEEGSSEEATASVDGDDSDDSSEMGDESPSGADDDAAADDGESDTDGDAPSGDGDGMKDADDDSESAGDGENGEASDDKSSSAGSQNAAAANDDESSSNDDENESGNDDSDAAAGTGGQGTFGGEPFSETDQAFREKESALSSDEDAAAPVYVQVPKDSVFNLDNIIIPNKEVVRAIKESAIFSDQDAMPHAAGDLAHYRKANAKVVNYLAKEFEMRKAADASKRTSVSKTGILNTNTLHSYKWNDDIFKKVANVADGKSHGLQMFVDWSGSMHSNMFGTLDQVLNLVLFCKKVGIPFDVYAFTDSYSRHYYNTYDNTAPADDEYAPKPLMDKSKLESGDFAFRNHRFNLMQIATSQGSKAAYNDMLLGLIMLRGHFNHYRREGDPGNHIHFYRLPPNYGLGGTPLNETIMTAIPVINRFREANRLQIVNAVFLTDGSGSDIHVAHNTERYRHYGSTGATVIRDKQSRKEFTQGYDDLDGQMPILLEMVRIRTGAKVVNFYVANPRPARFKNEWMSSVPKVKTEHGWSEYDTVGAAAAFKVAKAEGGVAIENSIEGWDHHYLIMGGNEMGVHDDERLPDDLAGAKKSTLKRAFSKSASNKLKNRVVLRKFTELIAA